MPCANALAYVNVFCVFGILYIWCTLKNLIKISYNYLIILLSVDSPPKALNISINPGKKSWTPQCSGAEVLCGRGSWTTTWEGSHHGTTEPGTAGGWHQIPRLRFINLECGSVLYSGYFWVKKKTGRIWGESSRRRANLEQPWTSIVHTHTHRYIYIYVYTCVCISYNYIYIYTICKFTCILCILVYRWETASKFQVEPKSSRQAASTRYERIWCKPGGRVLQMSYVKHPDARFCTAHPGDNIDGKRLPKKTMERSTFSWENSLFVLPFSIANG